LSAPIELVRESWQHQVYARAHAMVAAGGSDPSEDPRTFDWRYLLNVDKMSRALVIGSGFGFSACLFGSMLDQVWVVDPNLQHVELTAARARSMGLSNVTVRCCPDLQSVDGAPAFDLIVAGSPDLPERLTRALDFEQFAKAVRQRLGPGGAAQFTVRNVWSPLRARGGYAASLPAARRALARAGFDRLQVYAPLPHVDAAPLALVPIDSSSALRASIRDLIAIFDTVSPEARARYRTVYPMARLGMRLVSAIDAMVLVRLLVPGYCFLAHVPSATPAD
jgi:SAM-dependent methyltransferase